MALVPLGDNSFGNPSSARGHIPPPLPKNDPFPNPPETATRPAMLIGYARVSTNDQTIDSSARRTEAKRAAPEYFRTGA